MVGLEDEILVTSSAEGMVRMAVGERSSQGRDPAGVSVAALEVQQVFARVGSVLAMGKKGGVVRARTMLRRSRLPKSASG
jgi:hypothetical protein